MSDLALPEPLIKWFAFALPIAVLALLLAILLKRRGRKVADASGRAAEGGAEQSASRSSDGVHLTLISPVQEAVPLGEQIAEALRSDDVRSLGALYLALAKSPGQSDAARMSALRSAAGYGALHGPKSVHAEARLELAEAAVALGDMTSACEHWQLARVAFGDDGNKAAHDRVEKKMLDAGCPTDWVLTDF